MGRNFYILPLMVQQELRVKRQFGGFQNPEWIKVKVVSVSFWRIVRLEAKKFQAHNLTVLGSNPSRATISCPCFNRRDLSKSRPRNHEDPTHLQSLGASNGGCAPPQPINILLYQCYSRLRLEAAFLCSELLQCSLLLCGKV